MELLSHLTSRPVIVMLAVVGAIVATLASWLGSKPSLIAPRNAKALLRAGYAITWASVAAFIVAGFLSGR